MKADNRISDAVAVENEAAAWILKGEEGGLSSAERGLLEGWLSADSRHRAAYLRLREAWRFSAGLRAWRPAGAPVDPDLLASHNPSSARRWPLALAAMVVAGVVVAWVWMGGGRLYSTDVGGFQRVVLADGSMVLLNTGTKVKVRFSDDRREVELLRGEAWFDVAPDPVRPYQVRASGALVRAVGTAFAVRLHETQRVEVIVTDGRVALRDGTSTPTASAAADDRAESTPSGWRIKRLSKEEIDRRLAWQTGHLRFERAPLAVVVAEFNRYNRRRVEIADPALSGLEVHGSFKATDLTSFVAAMSRTLDIQVENAEGKPIRLFAR